MSTLLNIAIAEPSAIIRSGLEAVLKRLPGFRIQIIEIATAELLQETLRSHRPTRSASTTALTRFVTSWNASIRHRLKKLKTKNNRRSAHAKRKSWSAWSKA